jgi:hypothetical protein
MDLSTYERRSRRLAYASLFLLACIMHLFVVLLTMAAATSCVWPPCHDTMAFSAWQWLTNVPLLVTPWLRHPIEELGFAWSPGWVLLTALNSVLATALMVALARGGHAWARRVSRSRASSACTAARGK